MKASSHKHCHHPLEFPGNPGLVINHLAWLLPPKRWPRAATEDHDFFEQAAVVFAPVAIALEYLASERHLVVFVAARDRDPAACRFG